MSWSDDIGNYPSLNTTRMKNCIADCLYKYTLRGLDYVAAVNLLDTEKCECYVMAKSGVKECCGGKRVSEKCDVCRGLEDQMKHCRYCTTYGQYIHFKDLATKESHSDAKKKGKKRFVCIGEEVKIALWLALTKMVREVELAFETEEASKVPASTQLTYVLNWVIDNEIENPITPIISKIDEIYPAIEIFKDDYGLTSELMAKLRPALPKICIEESTINRIAVKYIDFLKALGLFSARFMWHRRQQYSPELMCFILDVFTDQCMGPDYVTYVKFSGLIMEYIEVVRENKERIRKEKKIEERKKKEKKDGEENEDGEEKKDDEENEENEENEGGKDGKGDKGNEENEKEAV